MFSPRDVQGDAKFDVIQSMKEMEQLQKQINVAKRREAHVTARKAKTTSLYDTRLCMWLVLGTVANSLYCFREMHCSKDARGALSHLFVPIVRVRQKVRMLQIARRLLIKAHLPRMTKPTVEVCSHDLGIQGCDGALVVQ